MKLNQLLVILATAMLFGCGGSGEKSQPQTQSSDLPQDISTPPPNEGAPERTDDEFTVQMVTQSLCGESMSEGVVIFHRQDGRVLLELETDSEGVLSTKWPKDTKHLSFIKISENEGEMLREIITWADISEHDLFEKVSFTSSECGCQQINFDLTLLASSNPGYYISGLTNQREIVTGTTISSLCNSSDSTLLFIDNGSEQDVRAGLFTKDDGSIVIPIDSDFKLAGDRINLSNSLYEQSLTIFHINQNGQVMSQSSKPMYIFSHDTLKYYLNSESNTVASSEFNWATHSNTTQIIEMSGDIEPYQPIDLTTALEAAVTQFSEEATATVSPSFEFASVDPRIDQIQFYVSWRDPSNGKVQWRFNGKPSGSFPDFWLGSQVQQGVSDATPVSNYLQLNATNFSGEYEAYVRYLHQANRNIYTDFNTDFLSNSTYFRVDGILDR